MTVSIRDPIHGSVALTPSELKIVDHRVFQRLRGIKQLGFTDQAFPGRLIRATRMVLEPCT